MNVTIELYHEGTVSEMPDTTARKIALASILRLMQEIQPPPPGTAELREVLLEALTDGRDDAVRLALVLLVSTGTYIAQREKGSLQTKFRRLLTRFRGPHQRGAQA